MDGWRIEAREQLRCSNSRSELPGDLPWNFTRGLWFRLPALRQALYDRQRLSAKSKVGTMLCGRVSCRKNSRPDLNSRSLGGWITPAQTLRPPLGNNIPPLGS